MTTEHPEHPEHPERLASDDAIVRQPAPLRPPGPQRTPPGDPDEPDSRQPIVEPDGETRSLIDQGGFGAHQAPDLKSDD